jgi:putative hemolysin
MIKYCLYHKKSSKTFVFTVILCNLMSCNAPISEKNTPSHTHLANPATTKCQEDGYTSQPVMTNGVPTGGLCVDQENNSACEEWAYFRGECQLGTILPTKPTPQKKSNVNQ